MLRKIFAGFLVFIFVLVMFVFAAFHAVSSNFNKELFSSDEFIDLLYVYSEGEFLENFDYSVFPNLSEGKVRDLFEAALSKEEVRSLLSQAVDQIEDLETSEDSSVLEFKFPLSFLEDKSDFIVSEVTESLYLEYPECDLDALVVSMDTFDCIPYGMEKDDFSVYVKRQLDQYLFSQMPSDIVFTVNVPDVYRGSFVESLSNVVSYVYYGFVILLVLLFLSFSALIFKPWHLVLRWQSVAVFSSSLLVSVFFYFLSKMTSLFEFLYGIGDFEVKDNLYNFLKGISDYYFSLLNLSIFKISLPLLFISLAVFIFTLFKARYNE